MSLLETRGLTVRFGGVVANDNIDLRVEEGHVVGLIGPNGAGKTTFIDAITGYVESEGTIELGGVDLRPMKPHQRSRAGLVRTFQSLELFDDLTVEDNMLVAAQPSRWYDLVFDILHINRVTPEIRARIIDALDVVGLAAYRSQTPAGLSHGQRKLVGVARALASAPRLVLLDEPAAGLDTGESLLLGERLRQLPAKGASVLLIDHDMGLVLSVCDYVYVLDFGRLIAQGTPTEIRSNTQVIEAYLGESARTVEQTTPAGGGLGET